MIEDDIERKVEKLPKWFRWILLFPSFLVFLFVFHFLALWFSLIIAGLYPGLKYYLFDLADRFYVPIAALSFASLIIPKFKKTFILFMCLAYSVSNIITFNNLVTSPTISFDILTLKFFDNFGRLHAPLWWNILLSILFPAMTALQVYFWIRKKPPYTLSQEEADLVVKNLQDYIEKSKKK
jgi:hypothetical protein